MKKILAIVLSLTMLLSIGLCFVGCDSNTDELNKQITELQAKLAEQTEKIAQLEDDIAAEQKKSEELQAAEQEKNNALQAELEVAKQEMEKMNKQLSDYYKGDIYELSEAYQKGLISQDNVHKIIEEYKKQFGDNIDYNSRIKEELGEAMIRAIKRCEAENIRTQKDNSYRPYYPEATEDYVYISKYFGKYDNAIAIIFNYIDCGWADVDREESVAGTSYIISGPDIRVWIQSN